MSAFIFAVASIKITVKYYAPSLLVCTVKPLSNEALDILEGVLVFVGLGKVSEGSLPKSVVGFLGIVPGRPVRCYDKERLPVLEPY
jgi:hypothetical protein